MEDYFSEESASNYSFRTGNSMRWEKDEGDSSDEEKNREITWNDWVGKDESEDHIKIESEI